MEADDVAGTDAFLDGDDGAHAEGDGVLEGVGDFVGEGVIDGYGECHVGEEVARHWLFPQFRVPVRRVEEALPAGDFAGGHARAEFGEPVGLDGFADEGHVGRVGRAVAFSDVAFYAGEHEVGPGVASAFGARDDVVDGEFGFAESLAAILAGVFVALEDVSAGEADFFVEEAVEAVEQDDIWDADFE